MMKFIIEAETAEEFEHILRAIRGTESKQESKPERFIEIDFELAEKQAQNKLANAAELSKDPRNEPEKAMAKMQADAFRSQFVNHDPNAPIAKVKSIEPIVKDGREVGLNFEKEPITASETQKPTKPTRQTKKVKEEAKNADIEEIEQTVLDQADAMGIYNPSTGEFTEEDTTPITQPAVPTDKKITVEDVRALCFPLNKKGGEAKAGVQKAIRATGAENFSAVPEDKFGQLYEELKALCVTHGIDPTTI